MRFKLSYVDVSERLLPEIEVGEFHTIKECRDIAIDFKFKCYYIYDTLEERLILSYGERDK